MYQNFVGPSSVAMEPVSRTPEGEPDRCPVCGKDVRIDPSRPPGDAPCPHCGHLLWLSAGHFERTTIGPQSLCVATHQTLTAGTCPWCGHAIINGRDHGESTDIRSRDVSAVAAARLRASLKDSNPLFRRITAAFLKGIGPDAREFLPDLTLLLQDAHQSVRDAAAQAIKNIEKRR